MWKCIGIYTAISHHIVRAPQPGVFMYLLNTLKNKGDVLRLWNLRPSVLNAVKFRVDAGVSSMQPLHQTRWSE
jgi:hypothetical protein